MPEYEAPGVYLSEITIRQRSIVPLPTSVVGFLGETERGATHPIEITSYADFHRHYGGEFDDHKYLPAAVRAFFDNGGSDAVIQRVVGQASVAAALNLDGLSIKSLGPGTAGNRIFARITGIPDTAHPPSTSHTSSRRFRLQLAYWANGDPTALPDPLGVNSGRADPTFDVLETFEPLSLEPDSPDYFGECQSALVELHMDTMGFNVPEAGDEVSGFLSGGNDGASVDLAAFEIGLATFNHSEHDRVALMCAPGIGNDLAHLSVQSALVDHCERHPHRFAVLECARDLGNPQLIDPRQNIDSKDAAIYYPWYHTLHPETNALRLVPPGGAVCGIYAKTDASRGVWNAPANVLVSGATGLEVNVTRSVQSVLNPRGVNCIRHLPGRGIRVWGARTLSTDPTWRYVSVRRFAKFVEASILASSQWVQFEQNAEPLWAQIRKSVNGFLEVLWRQGALAGSKPEEAFFLSVGAQTMTANDIALGRLVVHVGIAPTRPAEFVVLRIGQKTLSPS